MAQAKQGSLNTAPLFFIMKYIIYLIFPLLSSCANGKYVGPVINFSIEYKGVGINTTINPYSGKQPVEVQK